MFLALGVLAPGLACAECLNDTSRLDDVLAQYDRNKFTCSLRPAAADAGSESEVNYRCVKAPPTGRMQQVLITASIDRSSGCDVVTAVREKPIRNTSIRGLCRKGRPCNHGDYQRP
ncbi:MAG: hypothetical protein ACE5JZ_12500 [Kiloniellales bacterium]